jgi:transcriptional regulator with XRE-family HTH domain
MTPPMHLIRPVLVDFGRRVRAARLEAGLSQRQLAKRARMDRSYLQDVEYGTKNATLGTMVLLADALGCEVIDLLPRKGSTISLTGGGTT